MSKKNKKWSEINNTDSMVENLVVYCAMFYFLGSVFRMFDGWSTWEIVRIPLCWMGGWMLMTTIVWLWRRRRED